MQLYTQFFLFSKQHTKRAIIFSFYSKVCIKYHFSPLKIFSKYSFICIYTSIETKNDPFLQNSKPNSYSKLERRATHAETVTSQFTKRTFWHTNVAGVFVCALWDVKFRWGRVKRTTNTPPPNTVKALTLGRHFFCLGSVYGP